MDRRALPGQCARGADSARTATRVRVSGLSRPRVRTGAICDGHEPRRCALAERTRGARRAFRQARCQATRGVCGTTPPARRAVHRLADVVLEYAVLPFPAASQVRCEA